jgi:hypothetical protein
MLARAVVARQRALDGLLSDDRATSRGGNPFNKTGKGADL